MISKLIFPLFISFTEAKNGANSEDENVAPLKSTVKKVCGSMVFEIYLVGRSNHVEVNVLTKMSTCDCHAVTI